MRGIPSRRQRGAVAVEFGLIAFLLATTLIGAMEVGRLLWTWGAAAEATRLGARLAAVCTIDDADIKKRMLERLPVLADTNITLTYLNAGGGTACNNNSCSLVRVALQGYSHKLLVPLPTALGSIVLPPFSTTLPREVFNSANNPGTCS